MVNDNPTSRPELSTPFCSTCGEKTIAECEHCKQPLRGALIRTREVATYFFSRPPRVETRVTPGVVAAYCHGCGKPYPWVAAKINAAKAMVEELTQLTDAERLTIQSSIDDIAANTPMTDVAVIRVKKLLPKVLSSGGEALMKLIVDVASEAAAKALRG